MRTVGGALWAFVWAEDGFCLVLLALLFWVAHAERAWGRWI